VISSNAYGMGPMGPFTPNTGGTSSVLIYEPTIMMEADPTRSANNV